MEKFIKIDIFPWNRVKIAQFAMIDTKCQWYSDGSTQTSNLCLCECYDAPHMMSCVNGILARKIDSESLFDFHQSKISLFVHSVLCSAFNT